MTIQTINLNLIPAGVKPIINVSQYDKGQTWLFNLYTGSQPFSIPSGSTVSILGTKPDKTGFQYSCTFSGNVVTVIEQQQMTVIAGDVPAEIRITKSSELIGSLNFIISVEPAALRNDTIISDTELPVLIDLASGQVKEAEAWAKGTKDGTAVSSSDPQYHNNAYYWCQQAKTYMGPYGITDSEWTQLNTLWRIS